MTVRVLCESYGDDCNNPLLYKTVVLGLARFAGGRGGWCLGVV